MENKRPMVMEGGAEKLKVSLEAESILRNVAQKKDDIRKWGFMIVGGLTLITDPQLQAKVGHFPAILAALTEWVVKIPASQPHKKGAVMQGALKEIPEYARDTVATDPAVIQAFVDWLQAIDKPAAKRASFDEFVPDVIKESVAGKLK